MKYPPLAPDRVCKVAIEVRLTSGIDETGEPRVVKIVKTRCNYNEKSRQVLDAQRRLVQLSATAVFNGDIAPGLEQLEGYCFIDGGTKERVIATAERARNPDGTVNYTRLGLE
jgi:hypothetical protein